ELGYQRGKIQDESMLYEQRKHDGTLPIIGVNTFRNPLGADVSDTLELARATEEEKQSQLTRLRDFQARTAEERPAVLDRLRKILVAPFVGLVALAGCGNSPGRVNVASKDQPRTVVTAPPQESTTTTSAPPTSTTSRPAIPTTTRPLPSTTTTTLPATTTTT